MDELDQPVRASAAPPQGDFDAADVARRVRRRRRRRVGSGLGATLRVALLALGAVALLDGGQPDVMLDDDAALEPETFPRFEPGEVVAISVPDGEPAILVGSEDGARAFRAPRPISDGMRELVVWCRSTQTFLAPFGITLWTIDGDHVGGPAFGDLLSYRTDVDGDRVTVGPAQPRPDRAVGVTDPTDQPVNDRMATRAWVILSGMTHRVGPKGQVVIPKALRDELGLSNGDEVVFWREGDHIALAPARSERPLRGRFRDRPLAKQLEAERRVDNEREARR